MEINHVNVVAPNYGAKNQNQKGQKVTPSLAAGVAGVALGTMAQNGISTISRLPNKHIMKSIQNMCAEHQDSFGQVTNAVTEALKNKGVLDKGVKILDVTTRQGQEAFAHIMKDELNGHKVISRLPNTAKEIVSDVFGSMFASGQNAAYLPNTKTVVLAGDKLGLTAFHEVGHAINANASKIGKALQACRGTSILALPISLIAIFKRPKMEGQEPVGAVDKATTFVKKNAGKLTFATFLPMLIEEGMASVRGCKIAKTVSPKVFKATCKVNGLAYLTYLGVALAASIGVSVARNIRDKFAINSMKKKQAQAQQQLNAQIQAMSQRPQPVEYYYYNPSSYKIA